VAGTNTLVCKRCKCTYFKEIQISEFDSTPTSLYRGLPSITPKKIMAYECISCCIINLPPLNSIETTQEDIKLFRTIEENASRS